MQLTRWILAVAHVLAGAAWLGAMLYSLLVLHPRARAFFGSPRQFEDFISYVAAGARWKVLGGAAFIGSCNDGLFLIASEEDARVMVQWYRARIGKETEHVNRLVRLAKESGWNLEDPQQAFPL